MNQSELKSLNDFPSFKAYKQKNNRKVLIDIIIISLIMEILFTILAQVNLVQEGSLRFFINPDNLKYQLISIVILALLLFLTHFLYMKYSNLIGYLAVTFIIFQKILVFLFDRNSLYILVFWIIYSLLFAHYFMDGKLIVTVLISSYFTLLYGLLHFQIAIDNFSLYLGLMMISLIISICRSLQNYNKKRNEYTLKKNQQEKSDEPLQKLNLDTQTDLSYSYNKYSSIFHTDHLMAIVWSPEEGWPVAFVTDNISVLLGYTTEDLMSGKVKYEGLVHPDDIHRIKDEIQEGLKHKKTSFEQKYRIQKSDGTYTWIRDYNVPQWEGNSIIQINSYVYNVNSEVETEILLGENNKRLNNVVEATDACIWEWNLHSGLIKYSNRFLEMTGYSPDELQPYTIQSWKQLLHPDDLPLFNGVIEEYLSGHRDDYDIVCRIKHKQGNWIWIHDKGKIIDTDADEGDKPLVMFGNLIDITHIKETEAMLYHSEKLSALGRLSEGITHDLNNQLMKIQGTAEMAKIWDSKAHYQESLDTIETLCDSASWIIHQLMEYSGNNEYQPEICDLTRLLRELSKLLDHTFEKEIIVLTHLSDVKILVHVDQGLLKKAFFNICFNAKEAMSHGGTLKISSKVIRAEKRFATYTGDLPGGSYIKIEFSDEGRGISEEDVDKIFEPFFSTKELGTQGLGLAKVASVIKEHKGGIQVWSKVDIGSVFSIFLPYIETVIGENLSAQNEKQLQSNEFKEILIIDDELMICELLSAYFSQMKWKSRYFTNPLEGIEYFSDNHNEIGFVILDKFMPELNGDRVLEELVTVKEDIRALFISGFSQGIDENLKHQKNIAGYIEKPVKLDDLKKIIEEEFSL